MELCRINKDQAYKLICKLKDNMKIIQKSERKCAINELMRLAHKLRLYIDRWRYIRHWR